MNISKVGQIIIPVRDLPASTRFYEGLLGLHEKYAIPGEFVFLDGGGIELALREIEGNGPPDLTEIVFQVDDVRVAYEDLRARGVSFSPPPRAVTGNNASDLFATDFRDPDGHILSITSWVQKEGPSSPTS